MTKHLFLAAGVLLSACGAASAQLTGGDFATKYGAPLWTQNIGTAFGNSTTGQVQFANGSEIDALYATISGGTLYVGVAGNLETNFNKFNLVLDFMSGGTNTLPHGLPALGQFGGLTLDTGFDADALLSFTAGNNPVEWYLDGALTDGTGGYLGGGQVVGNTMSVQLAGANVEVSLNNSNVGGVSELGLPFDSDPGTVTTGLEWAIDLSVLGWDGSTPIKIAGWINGYGNDYMSNQVIGGLPDGTNSLGGDGFGGYTGSLSGIDFNAFDGLQYVVLVPSPGAMAAFGMAGLVAARRRRG
jgi:hypothetical protein